MDPVIVSAGQEKVASVTPQSVSVVDQDELDREQPTTIGDAMAGVITLETKDASDFLKGDDTFAPRLKFEVTDNGPGGLTSTILGGMIQADGTPEEILTSARLSTIYDTEIAVIRAPDGTPRILPDYSDQKETTQDVYRNEPLPGAARPG